MRRLLAVVSASVLLGLLAPPVRAEPVIVIGIWPQSYAQFLEIEAASGVALPYFRSRQRAGQFDANLIESDGAAAAAAGYSLGLDIQPKTGARQERTGIAYTDITAQLHAGSGPYYDKLVAFAHEVLALPTYGQVTHYLQFHSEANIQAPPGELDAQPYSGTGPEYQECWALVRALFDSMGVTDRIVWQVVLSRSAFEGNQGGPTNWFPADTSLYETVGVDSYRRDPTWLTPSQSFESALAFARSVGKDIWIDETGSDEGSPENSATAKAEWFAEMGSYVEAHRADIAGVVFSNAVDGGNWFFDSVLSGGRASPIYTGRTWEGWRAMVQRLASLPPLVHTLTVERLGEGSGTIMSAAAGIDCGAICSTPVEDGTQVTLTAVTDAGSVFEGWSGACAGTGECTVTMDADRTVSAVFDQLPAVTLPDADPAVAYGGWGGVVDPAASGGAYRVSRIKDERATWTSSSRVTSIVWIARAGPGRGKASVTIDGKSKGTVDLYATTPGAVSNVYSGLRSARHTVVIKVLGARSAASTGTSVTLDAFAAGAVTTQEHDPGIRYGSWVSTAEVAATDATYRATPKKNATVTVTFSGTSIDWITAKGRGQGQASVTIDGVPRGTVDLYASTTTFRSVVPYTDLPAGAHTMVIKVLGAKNAAATGTKIVVDGFVVQP